MKTLFLLIAILLQPHLSLAQRLHSTGSGFEIINKKGFISMLNSSSSVLGAGEVYTGTSEQIDQFSIITVAVDSDVDGVLSMQFSQDGTNWDRAKVVVLDQEIGSGSVHTLEVVSAFFRIVFTNNASSAQSHFRLQTIYHTEKSGFLTSSPDERISKANDAQLMRVSNDPILDISRNLYSDKKADRKFGHNAAVPNGSFADIWDYGATDTTYNWPTTDETFRVAAGGNSTDTSTGSGARTIQIVYLNSIGDQHQDQLTLAGSLVSTETSTTARRFIRAWVDTVGTINSNNTAEIVIENSSSGQVVGSIAAGSGQSEMTMYTVPRGFTAYLMRVEVDVATGSNKDADVKLWQRRDAYTTSAPFGAKRLVREWDAIQDHNPSQFVAYPSFPALTDLWFSAQGNGAITEVDINYHLICVKNEAPTTPQ